MELFKKIIGQFDEQTEHSLTTKQSEDIQKQNITNLTLTIQELERFTGLQKIRKWQVDEYWLSGEIDIQELSANKFDEDINKLIQSSIIRPSLYKKYVEWIQRSFNNTHGHKSIDKATLWTALLTLPLGGISLLAYISQYIKYGESILGTILAFMFIVISGGFWFIQYKRYKRHYEHQLTKLLKTLQPTRLGILLDEVDKFNQVVSHVSVMEQLTAIGHKDVQDRERILEVLKTMREDLVRALQTERILRENPNFKPELISSEAIPLLETLKFSEDAKEAQQLVQDAIDIGLRVQEEMKKLSIDRQETALA